MVEKARQIYAALAAAPNVDRDALFKLGIALKMPASALARTFSVEYFATYGSIPLLAELFESDWSRTYGAFAPGRAFEAAARNGRTDVMSWLKDHFDFTAKDMTYRVFLKGARNNQADVVDWYVANAGYNRRYLGNRTLLGLFFRLCSTGATAAAEAVAANFQITIAEAQRDGNAALRAAARNGHLDTVEWLLGYFSIDRDSPGVVDAVLVARNNGHEDIAARLMELLGLTEEDLAVPEEDNF